MKLVIAIVHDDDAGKMLSELTSRGFYATRLSTSGGFLRAGNTTILTGVEDEKVQDVCGIIENTCKSRKQITPVQTPITGTMDMFVPVYPVEVTIGGATIFVLNIEQFKKF